MLDFTLLGSFRVVTDGCSIGDALPRRCIALIAHVLLRRPNRLYRERLAATLWPDVTDSEARGKLRRHVYLIGQAIPQSRRDGWFILDGTTIGWNPAVAASIDVEMFREAVRSEAWHTAVATYGGDLLCDLDDEWLVDERDRLREQHLVNLERSALAHCAQNAHAQSISAAAELLRLEPLREAAVRLLMELRFLAHDRAGALAEYERFAQRLRDELDVDPMPETTLLYTNFVRRFNAEAGSQRSLPVTPISSGRQNAPFVGRESHLATLREMWTRALQQRGGVAFVGGESGAGKTRLVAELDALVAADGGIVLRGCTTFVESGPYQALFDALRSAAALLSHESTGATAWSAVLQTVIPELRTIDGTATLSALDAEAERHRLYESVVVAFESLAFTRPVLLVLEDLHWAGHTTVAMLGHLARRIRSTPLTIVVTYRDDDLARAHPLRELRRQLAREDNVAVVSLGPLTLSDVEHFLQLRFGSEGAALSTRYYEATEGLPLFLIELLADATLEIPALPPIALPSTLADMIEQRLADLSAGARTTLEIAAVIGSGFDAELIVEMTGWSEAETLGYLDDLLAKHVVRERPGGGATFAFAHEYYRENSYARIDRTKRRQRHSRVARALEDLYPGRIHELAPQLASHFEAAGDDQRAITYFLTSARNAIAVFANEDVVALTTRALSLASSQRDELDLLLLREEALRRTGQRKAQRADLDRAEPLAVVLDDGEATCEIVHRRIALLAALTERAQERAELDRATMLAAAQSPRWAARFALARGMHFHSVSDFRESRIHLERAALAFEALEDPRYAFMSYLKLAELERVFTSFDVAERHYGNAERQLAAMHDPRSLLMALYEERASFATLRQRYLEADAWARRFLAVAEEVGDVDGRARAHRHIGSAAAWRRDVVTAREHLSRAANLFEALEDRFNVYNVSAEFGLLALWLGRVDEAVARFEQAIDTARAINFAYGVIACTVNVSYALYVFGDFEAAALRATDVLQLADQIAAANLRGPALVNLGASLREIGRTAEAIETLREATSLAENMHLADLASEAWSHLALALAESGSQVDALAAGDRAGELIANVPHELRTGDRYWVLARAYARAGQSELARAALQDGKAIVLAQLASIPDEESRVTFRLLPAHRALLIDSLDSALSDALRTAYA